MFLDSTGGSLSIHEYSLICSQVLCGTGDELLLYYVTGNSVCSTDRKREYNTERMWICGSDGAVWVTNVLRGARRGIKKYYFLYGEPERIKINRFKQSSMVDV